MAPTSPTTGPIGTWPRYAVRWPSASSVTLNQAVPMASGASEGVRRQVNLATASKLFSSSIDSMLLIACSIAQGIHDWVITLSRCWTRHIPDRSRPKKTAHSKPHPSQSYKRVAQVRWIGPRAVVRYMHFATQSLYHTLAHVVECLIRLICGGTT